MNLRFYLFATIAALIPGMLVLFTTGQHVPAAMIRLEDRVSGATMALDARLEADGAKVRELLVKAVAHEGVVGAIHDAAKEGKAPGADAVARAKVALKELYSREIAELVALATPAGAQVVITSGEPRAVALADLPLAAATIRDGELGSLFAELDGALYRFHAAPVGVGEGALILGERIADASANRLRDSAKVQHLTIVSGSRVVLSTFPEDQRAQVIPAAERVGSTLATGALDIGIPALSSLGGILPVLGPTEKWRSLARPIGGGYTAIVTLSAEPEFGWLGALQAFGFGGTLFVLIVGVLWFPVIFGPINRQARSIEAHLARLRVEKTLKIGTKGFTKPFFGIAVEMDRLTEDRAGQSSPPPVQEKTPPAPADPPKPVVRPLDLPLAPSPTADSAPDSDEGTPSAFPFADAPAKLEPKKEINAWPAPEPKPKTAPTPVAEKKPERATTTPLDDALRAAEASVDSSTPIPLPGVLPPLKGGKPKDPFAAFGPTPEQDSGDRTREAVIPPELLAQSRELEQELLASPGDPDEEHFAQVFEEFVATRKKCGEAPDGLTLDKFTARLKKNREQLITKYNCRTVRFQVYVKDGKAAVKAAPVK